VSADIFVGKKRTKRNPNNIPDICINLYSSLRHIHLSIAASSNFLLSGWQKKALHENVHAGQNIDYNFKAGLQLL
jgi:hypothetical protein